VRLLALLLEHPGVDVHSLDLVAAVDGSAPAGAVLGAAGARVPMPGGHGPVRAGLQGSTGPALDAQAKEQYRARIDALTAQVAEAETAGDRDRATAARAELEFVSRELARSVGVGGRDRHSGSHAERARVNVTRAIRATLKRIVGYDAALGRELEETVRTGTFCSYRPDPRRPLRWQVQDAGAAPRR
jgi:hypothetical protein